TLRKAMKFADKCGLVRYRQISQLPGERNRTFILDSAMEKRYLELADYPLREVAILMLDLGLRPEEAVALRRENITEDAVTIAESKTPQGLATLPQTARTRDVFRLCF